MSYKTSQIIGIFYMQIGAHKNAYKTTFVLSDLVLLLVCHIGILVLKVVIITNVEQNQKSA